MSVGEVKIANDAIALVSGPGGGITALTDQSRVAQLAQQFYASSRDTVLESANWYFAIKVATLAVPTSGEDYTALVASGSTYMLPADCLRPIEISPHMEGEKDWIVATDRRLITSWPNPILKYIARIEDTSLFTPSFADAVAAYLAYKMAYPLTESTTKMEAMRAYYEYILKEAQTIAGSVGRQPRWNTTRATTIRRRRA